MSDIKAGNKQDEKVPDRESLNKERNELLQHLQDWLEVPMLILAFIWLALLIRELVWGENRSFDIIQTVIWIIFILNFALEFLLAPHKGSYLKSNWLTAVSLLIPALRIFRIFQVFRLVQLASVGRGLRLFQVISSLNRGMRALGASLRRRGFGYIVALTMLVVFAGSAGMYSFENNIPGGLNSYGEALWWTAMIMTTMGSQYWPQTLEGRVLCIFLALYAFTVFGYMTATLATFFVGRDAENDEAELPGAKDLAAIREELTALRNDIRSLSQPPEK